MVIKLTLRTWQQSSKSAHQTHRATLHSTSPRLHILGMADNEDDAIRNALAKLTLEELRLSQ